jgi:D-threo-aldose 1-dehydrogenase
MEAATLRTAARRLTAADITFGAIWIAPGGGDNGDGQRLDPGQANADETVAAALAAGIVEFDTAPWYGSGASEERLGIALRHAGVSAESARVTTKVGRLFRESDGSAARAGFDGPRRPPLCSRVCTNDYTAEGARKSLQESLDRLGIARVHALRIHDPNDNSSNRPGHDGFVDEVGIALAADGACAELLRLRASGVIDHVGLGMNCNIETHMGAPDQVLRMIRGAGNGALDSALLAGGWNLLSQAGLPCFAECEARGIAVHVAGVFASGVLASADPTSATYSYRKADSAMLARVEAWRSLSSAHGLALPAVAIAFAALPVCVTRIVLGIGTAEQVAANLRWVEQSADVPAVLWSEAKASGLLDASVPTPPCEDGGIGS